MHPQHMPAVKPRPPGPSRVGARRHGEVLAEERAGSRPCCPEGGFGRARSLWRGCFGAARAHGEGLWRWLGSGWALLTALLGENKVGLAVRGEVGEGSSKG